jgi:peptidoglycan/xylan/chitin deacetylase (PgdA/CDA1 family)
MIESIDKKYSRLPLEDTLEKVRVLLYHNITVVKSTDKVPAMTVQADTFRRHLELLDRWGYTSITFDDVRLFLAGELNLPNKPVIITFDGGYADVYDTAFPLLQEFGMKAVVFVIGDQLIRENIWDKDSISLSLLLNQQQILEIKTAGFEIGSQSMTHAKLTLIDEKAAAEEILRSRMMLEILLNMPVNSFAYPYGLVNETIKKITKDAGYTLACADYSGPALFGRDLFEVRRIAVADTSNWLYFRWLLQPAYLYHHWLQWKLKHILSGAKQPSIPKENKFDIFEIKKKKEHMSPFQ